MPRETDEQGDTMPVIAHSLSDLLALAEDAPVLARVTEHQPSPQEFDCGCIAVYWIDDAVPGGEWSRELRLVVPCDGSACDAR